MSKKTKPQDTKNIVQRFEAAQDSLVLQSSDLSLDTISQMAEKSAIDLAPKYQRRNRWKIEGESALIESFLLNVPVPPVYLSEDDFGTYSVIDGKQRITAIHKFMTGRLKLTGLKKYKEIEGFAFNDLPPSLRNALTIRPYIRAVTLLKQTDAQLKYEVFTRLNTGGQPLLAQEIRNAIYRGSLNELLFTLAKSKFLRAQLKIVTQKESAYTEMSDVEMVLRFFTIKNLWANFTGDYRRSMDSFMEKNREPGSNGIKLLESEFIEALARCEKLFGGGSFRRFVGGSPRDQFLATVYDAQMISVNSFSKDKFANILLHKKDIYRQLPKLFSDKEFDKSIRVSTNTPSRVKYRVQKMIEILNSFATK